MNPDILALLDQLDPILQYITANSGSLNQETQAFLGEFLNEVSQFLASAQPPTEHPLPLGTDLLWQLAAGDEASFSNYLRTVPDPALNQLLRNPAQLRSTIQQLQRQMPPDSFRPGEADGIPQAQPNSSNIYGFQYDPQSGDLLVRFQSGAVYGYTGVPRGVFNIFQQGAVPAKTSGRNQFGEWWVGKQPSLGAAFYEMIRSGGYPYERVA